MDSCVGALLREQEESCMHIDYTSSEPNCVKKNGHRHIQSM